MPSTDLTNESFLTRDMITARIDELRVFLAPFSGSDTAVESERSELEALAAFEAECESYCADWKYGEAAIREDAFLAHITQLIDDCYEMPKGLKTNEWPYRHLAMDYTAAAEEAKQDYTEIELCGVTYFVR